MKKWKMLFTLATLLSITLLFTDEIAYGQSAWITFGGQSKRAAKRSFLKGRLAAKKDLKKGQLGYKAYGMIDSETSYFIGIMQNNYGINVDWVAGCIVMPWEENAAAGYNSVMVPIIERKYGKGIWSEAGRRAVAASIAASVPVKLFVPELPPWLLTSPMPSFADDIPPPPQPKKN
jgi:hypothetical protein